MARPWSARGRARAKPNAEESQLFLAASTAQSDDEDAAPAEKRATLADLEPGQQGTVVRIRTTGDTARRLMEMGVVRGEVVRVVKCAPFGDPIELELEGYHLSLRKREARTILVDTCCRGRRSRRRRSRSGKPCKRA